MAADLDRQLDRAMAYQKAGRLAEAQRLYAEIVRLQPRNANALHLLGLVLHQQGQNAAAIAHLRQAALLAPKAEVVWTNLSAVHQALGQHPEAAAAAREALRLNAGNAQAHFNLGCALQSQEQFAEAGACFRQALQARANWAMAHANLALALRRLDQIDDAKSAARKALELDPRQANALNQLALVLKAQGQLGEAVEYLQKAIEAEPEDANAHRNLGTTLLLQGDFERGLEHNEWRWRTGPPIFAPRGFAAPQWQGEPLAGKTLLVHAEQGLGDTFQFVRYLPLLQARGGRVIFECQKPLHPILANVHGCDQLAVRGDTLSAFDYHLPLLSAPFVLGTRLENIPAQVPYLHARSDLVDLWRERLRDFPGLKVGICWQGNPKFLSDRQRSFALQNFAPLAELPGVHLVSLQKGTGTEQLAKVPFPVHVLAHEVDAAQGPFMDTAAVMRNLDLVITTDTALAHLAGALNVPVWVALSHVPDWRWLLERDDSPWYPSMRLFRQPQPGDWNAVFQKIREALQQRLANRSI